MPDTGTTHTPRWGMTVDVNRCVGCQTCTVACKHWNDTQPGVQWRRVLDVESGSFPDVERVFLVVGCQHCAEPPCVPVCPTGATKQRADGLVTMDYDICIGCASCAVACPYQARTIVHKHNWYYGEETAQEDAVRHKEREGVAQKCTFCVDKLDDGLEQGKVPGVDWYHTPSCAAACIASAITFGDFNDPESKVSQLAENNSYFQMHAELGTDPQIKYLYETPAVPGREPDAGDTGDERLADPANPLVGQRQKFWDWRAAMNWCFGGLGTGFAIVGALAYLFVDGDVQELAFAQFGAAILMAIGLFFVWLKIGRKFRAWRAIFRPQTSWMTRELYAAAVFFPATLIGLVFGSSIALLVAAVAALTFLVCQAKILHMAKGIPAWRAPLVPAMIFSSGLFEGVGLTAVLLFFFGAARVGGGVTLASGLAVAGMALAVLNAALWLRYRQTAKANGIPPLAREAIDGIAVPLHLAGHAVPFILFAIALLATTGPSIYLLVGGMTAVIGGIFWKYGMVVRAGFQQGYALGKLPQRGSGAKAAPARTQGFAPTRAAAE
jgi:phenylacetyl-CoA:acceptor oxidoreductase subunit 1